MIGVLNVHVVLTTLYYYIYNVHVVLTTLYPYYHAATGDMVKCSL